MLFGVLWTLRSLRTTFSPLIFLKRISDVFEDEIRRYAEELGDEALAAEIVEGDRRMVRFYIPP